MLEEIHTPEEPMATNVQNTVKVAVKKPMKSKGVHQMGTNLDLFEGREPESYPSPSFVKFTYPLTSTGVGHYIHSKIPKMIGESTEGTTAVRTNIGSPLTTTSNQLL